jgi:RNA polymerase sigma-70 factor (ECF subfamily)
MCALDFGQYAVAVGDREPALATACVSTAHVSTAHATVIGNDDVTADRSTDAAADAAMDRYAAGEADAFAVLYDLLAPRLYGFLMRQTRNPARAEDLVQQTLLHIHCARGRFIRGAPVTPWAFAIARRLLIDETRKNRLDGARTSDPEGDRAYENAVAVDRPADEQVHSSELARMIRRELDRLPEGQRAAFELVKHEGLSHAEAADVLGTTVMAVKLRAHRTYEALRAALGPVFDLGDV